MLEQKRSDSMSPLVRGLTSLLILAAGGGAYAMLVYRPTPKLGDALPVLPSLVVTEPVSAHDGLLDIDVDGVVVPYRELTIAAEVSGRVSVKSSDCRAGTVVRQGTPLLEIDARDYQLDVERLNKQVAQAQAAIQELYVESTNSESLVKLAEEDVELSRAELTRLQKLATGSISDSALDQAKRSELSSRNTLQSLRNQLQLLRSRQARLDSSLQLAEADLAKAKLDLERTRIVSPITGVIVRESIEQDSFVQKGTTLVTIEDISSVEVRCNLKMEQVAWLWRQSSATELASSPQGGYQIPPTPVTVSFGLDGQTHSWPGQLARYEGIGIDERTRTVPCRVVVENPRGAGPTTEPPAAPEVAPVVANKPVADSAVADSAVPNSAVPNSAVADATRLMLVRGMYVSVRLHLSPNVSLLRVPEEAIRPGRRVWVMRDHRVLIQENLNLVTLATLPGADGVLSRFWLVAVNGETTNGQLRVGDRVIVSPLSYVANGLEVRERR